MGKIVVSHENLCKLRNTCWGIAILFAVIAVLTFCSGNQFVKFILSFVFSLNSGFLFVKAIHLISKVRNFASET